MRPYDTQSLPESTSTLAGWPLSEHCATPMAIVDRELGLQAVNVALLDWLGAGARNWRGEALAVLDAKPPLLSEAAARAFAQDRRIWLREARLRTAIGDRGADLALTPLDARALLLEVLPPALGDAASGSRLSESLRGFAHEVRGPLAGMRGAAQLLQRRVDGPDLQELAGLIVGEVDRLADLSERLLHTGAKPRLARVNIHEVIERVAALIAAGSAPPRLRRDYDPSLPPVSVDADRLQQALLNLARNAVEAGAHELTLRTRAEHGARIGEHAARLALRVDVADDGRGVPAALADTLFEPLVSGRADGSGLGLALSREIAREHGGELGYTSRPGATVFSLLLPVKE
ncbi:two-component system sensor histidine kinase NtrB [Dokdonella soli]|uniref:histidine kinase n=1 Tax=Dokdonella soli TaxID=529810 RepID=A0ABN1IEE5_9GAMM